MSVQMGVRQGGVGKWNVKGNRVEVATLFVTHYMGGTSVSLSDP
jgi:hypothetical protein